MGGTGWLQCLILGCSFCNTDIVKNQFNWPAACAFGNSLLHPPCPSASCCCCCWLVVVLFCHTSLIRRCASAFQKLSSLTPWCGLMYIGRSTTACCAVHWFEVDGDQRYWSSLDKRTENSYCWRSCQCCKSVILNLHATDVVFCVVALCFCHLWTAFWLQCIIKNILCACRFGSLG